MLFTCPDNIDEANKICQTNSETESETTKSTIRCTVELGDRNVLPPAFGQVESVEELALNWDSQGMISGSKSRSAIGWLDTSGKTSLGEMRRGISRNRLKGKIKKQTSSQFSSPPAFA